MMHSLHILIESAVILISNPYMMMCRIQHSPTMKSITVYGYSQAFGQAEHRYYGHHSTIYKLSDSSLLSMLTGSLQNY